MREGSPGFEKGISQEEGKGPARVSQSTWFRGSRPQKKESFEEAKKISHEGQFVRLKEDSKKEMQKGLAKLNFMCKTALQERGVKAGGSWKFSP